MDALTGGKVAYIYVPNTSAEGFARFNRLAAGIFCFQIFFILFVVQIFLPLVTHISLRICLVVFFIFEFFLFFIDFVNFIFFIHGLISFSACEHEQEKRLGIVQDWLAFHDKIPGGI